MDFLVGSWMVRGSESAQLGAKTEIHRDGRRETGYCSHLPAVSVLYCATMNRRLFLSLLPAPFLKRFFPPSTQPVRLGDGRGMSIRFLRSYDIRQERFISRFDAMVAVPPIPDEELAAALDDFAHREIHGDGYIPLDSDEDDE